MSDGTEQAKPTFAGILLAMLTLEQMAEELQAQFESGGDIFPWTERYREAMAEFYLKHAAYEAPKREAERLDAIRRQSEQAQEMRNYKQKLQKEAGEKQRIGREAGKAKRGGLSVKEAKEAKKAKKTSSSLAAGQLDRSVVVGG